MLAILATHPVPYQVPVWKALGRDGRVPFEVWYLTHHGVNASFDGGFGKTFAWDIDLLSEYNSRLLSNGPTVLPDGFMALRLDKCFRQMLRGKRVKALWIQGWQVRAYWEAVWQARAEGIQVWLRGESNDLAPSSFIKKYLKKVLLGQLFRRVDNFLYIGKANRRLYESYDILPEKLHPAPYCADNRRFAQQAKLLLPRRAHIRKTWKIPEEAFCVLFVGKFIPKKRPLDLVSAARSTLIKKMKAPLHLVFTGSGELGDQLRANCNVLFDAESPAPAEKITNSNGLPSASFVGFLNQTEISKAYVAADCMVLPSDHGETWGLVVNEALASGLPCAVSSRVGCGEDVVATMNPRLRFGLGDIEGLANALLELNSQRYSREDAQAQVEKYNTEATVDTVVKLYHQGKK
ncbi:MAG: glycosyltransferase [Nitrospiraceae bacterium]|nr:MAG: glycosyltransferase [Nitrospiraceae bacterium]